MPLPRILATTLLLLALTSGAQADASNELARRYSPEAWQASRQYKNVKVITQGEGTARAYIFMPDAPELSGLPLVLFHHGWLGMNPGNYGGLIDLIVRHGAVVIYPVYQDGDNTAPQDVTRLAAKADQRALTLLENDYPGLVNKARTFYWGFSMGASISLNLSINPSAWGLPEPRALMMVAPGDAHHVSKGMRAASIIGPAEILPAGFPVVIATGASDTSIGVPTARSIAARICHLPATQRKLILFPSDEDGGIRITAGHGSIGSPDSRYNFPDPLKPVTSRITGTESFEASRSLNLLDFYGYWRISMRLLDYVKGGEYPEELFRAGSAENRFLGFWPSGKPYAEAQTEDPCP